jgi:hypothetical protein
MTRFGLVGALLLVASSALAAGTKIVINGAGDTSTRPCEGNDVVVNGAGHRLAFTGECKKVVVNGSGNQVAVEAAARIAVQGTGNVVSWQRGAGKLKKPRISVAGVNNKAVKAEGAAAAPAPAPAPAAPPAGAAAPPAAKAAPFRVHDNGQKITRACNNGDVEVAGNENDVTLTGDCNRVAVTGNTNHVQIEGAVEIGVLGNDNNVRWKRGVGKAVPKVSNPGNGNQVLQVK